MKKVLVCSDVRLKDNGITISFMNMYDELSKEYAIDVLVFTKDAYDYNKKYLETVNDYQNNVFFIEGKCNVEGYKNLRKFFEKHNYDIIHINCSTYKMFLAFVIAIQGKPHIILESHTNGKVNNILVNCISKYIIRPILQKKGNSFLACSQDAGRVKFGKKFFDRYGVVVKNCIDVGRFINECDNHQLRLSLGIPDNAIVLGTVGRVSPEKNQKIIVDIVSKMKAYNENVYAIIVGSGNTLNECKEYAEEKNVVKNVFFLGERSDIPFCLGSMDIFLFPSLFEGFGIAALEAQASGKPVICSNGVSRDVNVTGNVLFINNTFDIDEWIDAIKKECQKEYKNNVDLIIAKGYDIKSGADLLTRVYENKM